MRAPSANRIAGWLVIAIASAGFGLRVPAAGADLRSGAAAQVPEHFRVLTYNVYTAPRAPGVEPRLDLLAASADLRGYDVVILNELFNDDASEHLLAALRLEYPYQTPVVGRSDLLCAADNTCWDSTEGPFSNDRIEDGGVAILSKWPIQVRRQSIFTNSCDVDGFANKGFAYVRIDLNGTPVHVIGTHLQADPSSFDLGERLRRLQPCLAPKSLPQDSTCPGQSQTAYEAVRLSQLMQISAWIEQQEIPTDQMVIIGGDMNVDKEGNPAEYDRMRCVLNVSEPLYGHQPQADGPWYTYDSRLNALVKPEETSLYIDYVFVRHDHAEPVEWHNDVILTSSFPANWDGGSARGYEFSDHFPVTGYIASSP